MSAPTPPPMVTVTVTDNDGAVILYQWRGLLSMIDATVGPSSTMLTILLEKPR